MTNLSALLLLFFVVLIVSVIGVVAVIIEYAYLLLGLLIITY